MVRVIVFACILAALAIGVNCSSYNAPSLSPSPSTDCSTIIYDMADCITFISNGSKEIKPDASCCSGFITVLQTNPSCICEAIRSSAELGIELNLTKAMTLPSACGVSAPSLNNCGIPVPPGAAPANPPNGPQSPPPKSAPSPEPPKPPAPVPPTAKTPAPGASISGGGATAPSPATAGAYSTPTSFAVLVSLLVASFSFISA